jgi:hypothetical protein
MSDKAVVIISSGEVEKALTGLMWATNALRFGWMEDVRVIFFGPAQNLILEDERVKEMAGQIAEAEKPIFCKFISDRDGKSEQLEQMGMDVQYVGTLIADFIKDGYVPMVW